MSNIKVESAGIEASATEFIAQMAEMETLLASIKEETNNIKSHWSGDDSDQVLGVINNFMKVFEVVSTRNKSYSDFLEKVIVDYKAKDDSISNQVNS